MTIDEALNQIAGSAYCYIAWRGDEIVSVTTFEKQPGPSEMLHTLGRLPSAGPHQAAPSKARFFETAKVTREVLEQEADAYRRVAGRVAILNQWADEPAERLLARLESGIYESPMGGYTDAEFLVRHLFRFHRVELAGPLRERLRKLADSGAEFPGVPHRQDALAVAFDVRCCVAALDGDVGTLVGMWHGEPVGPINWRNRFTLMECFAYAGGKDRSVIDGMIRIVEEPGLFGPRYEAMLNLGRIGSAAGPRAVEVIRASIYDSSPELTAVRERVCERISTPDDAWQECTACQFGYVQGQGDESRSAKTCPSCLGLGVVRK